MSDDPSGTERPQVAVGPGRAEPSAPSPDSPPKPAGYPILSAKVQRPPLRPETLQRDRLLEWLSVKIHHRVVFVTAEAGYGKTTLLADFSRRTRLRTLWYRVDEEERDWIGVLNYLVASGREVDPAFGSGTASLLRDMTAGGPARETIIETFVREVQALGNGGAAWIIDDYHLLDDLPDVRALIRELVTRAPERVSFVFLSRRRPALPIARLKALGEVAELTREDLRFSEHETDRLFRESYGRPLEADVLADLTRKTEGWAASLQLVQSALRDRSPVEVRAFVRELRGVDEDLIDYLAEEVVGDLDDPMQQFLMRTSVLQAVDPEIASVAASIDADVARRLIERGERLGLLSRRGEQSRHTVRYHPLVRDFLSHRLREALGSAGVVELHRLIARFGEARDWRLAAHHYAAAGDIADLHRVIDDAIFEIMANGHFATAQAYVEQYPRSKATPAIEIIRSRGAYLSNDLDQGLRIAELAVQHSADGSKVSDLALLNLSAIQVNMALIQAAVHSAQSLSTQTRDPLLRNLAEGLMAVVAVSEEKDILSCHDLLLSIKDDHARGRYQHFFGVTLLNLAVLDRELLRPEDARQNALAAIEELAAEDSGPEMGAAQSALGWALAHLGQLEAARGALELAASTPHRLTRMQSLVEAADIEIMYGDLERAGDLVEKARLPAASLDGYLAFARPTLTELQIVRGDLDGAKASIAAADSDPPQMQTGRKVRLLTLRGEIGILEEDIQAESDVRAALDLAIRQNATLRERCNSILLAALRSAHGFDRAVQTQAASDPAVLSLVAEVVARRLGWCSATSVEMIRIEASKRPERWRPALRTALRVGDTDTRLGAARLLDHIGSREDVESLRAFVKASRVKGSDHGIGRGLARRLADRVYVEDLGRVHIRVGSRDIPGTDVRRKVLSLLCFLLSRPNMSAARDQVLDALWPDLEPTVALNSLNQSVYFLRRVFEPEYKEDLSANYVHHQSDLIWLDSELIASRSTSCANMMDDAASRPNPDRIEDLARTYTGQFALDFAYEEWAGQYRDGLHARFLELMETSIRSDLESGHYDRGLGLARRAVAAAPEADQVELLLLRLYARSGAHAAAAEQYAHYASVLRTDLGVEPPPFEQIK